MTDPNTLLAELRDALNRWRYGMRAGGSIQAAEDAARAAERLDYQLSRGGAWPDDWLFGQDQVPLVLDSEPSIGEIQSWVDVV